VLYIKGVSLLKTTDMLVLLSCAKTMNDKSKVQVPETSKPAFQKEASEIALYMSQYSVEELEQILRINAKIAVENYKRFQNFHSGHISGLPAVLAYTGIVFKRLNPKDFTDDEFLYAQTHLRLTSFCYGLLKPRDLIKPYRLEGDVKLPELGNKSLYNYWKPLLTDLFIREIKAVGGILCNLASEEMKSLFDWKRVTREIRVVTPEFKVSKNGKWTTIVIYTKMSRGEMTRYILKNRITDPEMLKGFTWEGFEYNEELSDGDNMIFTN